MDQSQGAGSDNVASTRGGFDPSVGVAASKVKVVTRSEIESLPEVAYSSSAQSRAAAQARGGQFPTLNTADVDFIVAKQAAEINGRTVVTRSDVANLPDEAFIQQGQVRRSFAGQSCATADTHALATESQPKPQGVQGDLGIKFSRSNGGFEQSPDAEREFKETERAYGGREAYDRAKTNGKTKLNYRQWVQVRTPRFKRWFGNWQFDPSARTVVVQVGDVPGNVDLKSAESVRDWILSAEDFATPVFNSDAGVSIEFSKGNLRASIKRRGTEQRQAFSALRSLIENAKLFGFEESDRDSLKGQDIYYAALRIGDKTFSVKSRLMFDTTARQLTKSTRLLKLKMSLR